MSNAIGSIGSNPSMMMGGMQGMRRPDPSKMADNLFSKLDTKGQGYIEKSDLQSAFDQVSSSRPSSGGASVDEVFQALDGDGDGKVTRQDMSDGIQKLADQLEGQFQNMRMQGKGGGMGMMRGMGGMGGMGSAGGVSRDELSGMVDSAQGSAQRMDALLANFDTADADQDGKISAQEARSFQEANAPASTAAPVDDENRIMMQVMELARYYNQSSQYDANETNTISVAA
jgi:Ca2+-binding EF-hand superfamily protein